MRTVNACRHAGASQDGSTQPAGVTASRSTCQLKVRSLSIHGNKSVLPSLIICFVPFSVLVSIFSSSPFPIPFIPPLFYFSRLSLFYPLSCVFLSPLSYLHTPVPLFSPFLSPPLSPSIPPSFPPSPCTSPSTSPSTLYHIFIPLYSIFSNFLLFPRRPFTRPHDSQLSTSF